MLIFKFLTLFFVSLSTQIVLAATIDFNSVVTVHDLGPGVKPNAINNLGVVVGQNANGEAFKWEQNAFQALGTLGGSSSSANDINDDGVIVGWSLDSSGIQKSFKWDGSLVNIDANTVLSGSAESINNLGEIAGWRSNGSVFRSTLWNEGSPDGELLFGTQNTRALGINDSGDIVGGFVSTNGELTDGYYWNPIDDTADVTKGLFTSYVPNAGINNNNLTAGSLGSSGIYLDVFENSPHGIPLIAPSDVMHVLGLNDLNITTGDSGGRGFIFDITTQQLYDANEFSFSNKDFDSILKIIDINDRGEFIGIATYGGVEHGIKGSFVPEPSTFAIAATAIGGFVLWRRQNGETKR